MTRGKKVLIGLVVLAVLAGGGTFAFFELTRTDRFLKDVTWNGPAGWSEAAIAAHREKIDYLVARVASEPAIRFEAESLIESLALSPDDPTDAWAKLRLEFAGRVLAADPPKATDRLVEQALIARVAHDAPEVLEWLPESDDNRNVTEFYFKILHDLSSRKWAAKREAGFDVVIRELTLRGQVNSRQLAEAVLRLATEGKMARAEAVLRARYREPVMTDALIERLEKIMAGDSGTPAIEGYVDHIRALDPFIAGLVEARAIHRGVGGPGTAGRRLADLLRGDPGPKVRYLLAGTLGGPTPLTTLGAEAIPALREAFDAGLDGDAAAGRNIEAVARAIAELDADYAALRVGRALLAIEGETVRLARIEDKKSGEYRKDEDANGRRIGAVREALSALRLDTDSPLVDQTYFKALGSVLPSLSKIAAESLKIRMNGEAFANALFPFVARKKRYKISELETYTQALLSFEDTAAAVTRNMEDLLAARRGSPDRVFWALKIIAFWALKDTGEEDALPMLAKYRPDERWWWHISTTTDGETGRKSRTKTPMGVQVMALELMIEIHKRADRPTAALEAQRLAAQLALEARVDAAAKAAAKKKK